MKAITLVIISCMIFLHFNLSSCQNSQTDPLRDKIKKEAEIMSKLLVDKNYENFIEYMYPPLIEMMGGKEKCINIFNQSLLDGNTLESVKISYPSDTIIINNQIQCTLKEQIEMKVKGGKLIAVSTLIGISDDNGNTWHFLDANSKSLEMLKKGFPNLSSRLILVENSKPTYIRE